MASSVAVETPEHDITLPFIEAACLEAEGVEPSAAAAATTRFLFRLAHQFATDTASAQVLRHEQHVDV